MSYLKLVQSKCTVDELTEALNASVKSLRKKPWDEKTYRAETNDVVEVGDYLLKELKQLKYKFWLIGEKRKINKKKIEEVRVLLQALNFHVMVLKDFRYCNEWRTL